MTVDDEAVERLVEAARAGDPEAFGSLFDHYHGPVHRYVAARVGRPSDAEDLAQLVFVKALEAIPRYESRGVPFGGWLFRLARNVVIDHVRTRRDHTPLDLAIERPSADDGPDELAALRQELDGVAAAMRRLTPDQREAIELRFFAGLSARGGGGGDGPAGRHRSGPPVPGHRGTPSGPGHRARRRRGPGPGLGDGPVNEDPMQALEPRAGDELERLIERYGRVRLDPSPAQSRRARAAVMEAGLAPAAGARARRGRRQDSATPGIRGGAGRSPRGAGGAWAGRWPRPCWPG